jgi:4-hydroxybenzoate polyprenyltransferase
MITRLLAPVCDLDHLVRLHQVGFVAIWPLLGLASVADWSPGTVAGLLAISVLFNTYGVLLDDAVHLDVDRRDPLRAHRWLVRGIVTPKQAVAVALLQLPLAAAVHAAAGFRIEALPYLGGAVVGQSVYDVYGKRCRVPPLMEAAEAAAAVLLVLYGAAATGGTVNAVTWLTAGAGAAFILLVNAFHGSLRDIEVEIGCGQWTTPIWLGCRGVRERVVHISGTMSVYAGLCQIALIVLSLATAPQHGLNTTDRLLVIGASVAAVANGVLFVLLHTVRKPLWDVVMRVHVAALLLPLMLAFAPRLGPARTAILLLVFFSPTVLTGLFWLHRTRAAASAIDAAATARRSLSEQDLAPRLAGHNLDLRRFVDEHRRPPDRQPENARFDRQA